MVKLDQLSYFLEAARLQHLGKAARSLAISAGAISHSISSLEEEFGKELFLKRGKRIYLTEPGKRLAERAKRLLEEAQSISEELSTDQKSISGHFRMAATHMVCSRFLIRAWTRIQTDNPALTGEVFSLRSSQVATGVISREFDFGLCFNPQSHIDLESETLRTGAILIVLRKGHPVFREKNQVQALSSYRATLPKAFQGIDVCEKHPVFEKFSIPVDVACLVDSYEIALENIAHSDNWTFLPDFLFKDDKRFQALRKPPGWDALYHLAAIWPRYVSLPKPMKRLLDELATINVTDVEGPTHT